MSPSVELEWRAFDSPPMRLPGESTKDAIKRHTAAAASLTGQMLENLIHNLTEAADECLDAAELDAIQPGVQDLLRKLADRIKGDLVTISVIRTRGDSTESGR